VLPLFFLLLLFLFCSRGAPTSVSLGHPTTTGAVAAHVVLFQSHK
jgi:hypothetical protein